MNISKIKWLYKVEMHDYSAAESYLKLVCLPNEVSKLVLSLRRAKLQEFKAKDIFRASSLSLLGVSNSHVIKDIKKIKKNIPLSPLLLVADTVNRKLIIADGYHRLCAVYGISEDAWIPCKVTTLT